MPIHVPVEDKSEDQPVGIRWGEPRRQAEITEKAARLSGDDMWPEIKIRPPTPVVMRNNAEILAQAIQKAIDGGWSPVQHIKVAKFYSITDYSDAKIVVNLTYQIGDKEVQDRWHVVIWWLIFNHDFAKTLWPVDGLERIVYTAAPPTPTYGGKKSYAQRPPHPTKGSWQYHLQRMVIADDPLQYLGEHLS